MVNDMTIIYGITVFFVLVGVISPFVNDSFSSLNLPENDMTGLTDDISEEETIKSTSAFKVFANVFLMFFWTFGTLPTWLDLILFVPMRVILVLIIARNIWIGGGS